MARTFHSLGAAVLLYAAFAAFAASAVIQPNAPVHPDAPVGPIYILCRDHTNCHGFLRGTCPVYDCHGKYTGKTRGECSHYKCSVP
ncbi:hypothetical protein EJ03DRAFT_331907 [Teratosphaeria nubilosa]|uniref:Chitin-binding type-2 domain-containing protein n=1 Tax=Teratosphaeria nubilosa TaxID=161662 RepID=A0A6G1KVP8_9PEZI|nr:hypothetical protein EJ03DRAFT_331907 [Teratosphaeria nubilosa]